MSNSQLRTDIPVLPSLPPNLSPANPDAPPSPDTPFASPATPVGQMVETPNWSERLETGTIEFEIAPGKDGQPEARVLAMADAVAPLDEGAAQSAGAAGRDGRVSRRREEHFVRGEECLLAIDLLRSWRDSVADSE